MSARRSRDVTELVPLADRVRWMLACRVAGMAAVTVLWWLTPEWRGLAAQLLLPGVVLLLLSVLAAALTPKLPRNVAVGLFTAALLADGAYLAWTLHLTGGVSSPAVYLAAVQVTAAALLGSFGTGLKLALWHSLATLVVLEAHAAGLLVPPSGGPSTLQAVDLRGYTTYLLPVWTAALVTAAFAAVNERELRRRRYDAEALRKLSVELEQSDESAAVGTALLRFVTEELGATRAAVTFWATGGPADGLPAALPSTLWTEVGQDTPLAGWEEPPGERSLVRVAEARRAPVLTSGFRAAEDPFLARVMPSNRNTVLVPLYVHDTIRGVLAFQHPGRRGSGIERRTVGAAEQAAAHTAMGIARAVLLTSLRTAASTDGLTQLTNRRAFDEALRRDLEVAARADGSVALVLIDLDHFKRLNDEWGHLAGDDVLRAVAEVLREHARQGDTAARYGGEELALVLPGADLSGAVAAAERVRAAIAQVVAPAPVTASLGVAVYPSCASDGPGLIAAADEALYVAKDGGRNQVHVAPSRQPVVPAQHWPADAVPVRHGQGA